MLLDLLKRPTYVLEQRLKLNALRCDIPKVLCYPFRASHVHGQCKQKKKNFSLCTKTRSRENELAIECEVLNLASEELDISCPTKRQAAKSCNCVAGRMKSNPWCIFYIWMPMQSCVFLRGVQKMIFGCGRWKSMATTRWNQQTSYWTLNTNNMIGNMFGNWMYLQR